MEQTYTQKVLSALKDDGRESLSFKDVQCLTAEEMRLILPIAAIYRLWLDAAKERSLEVLGAEAEYILRQHGADYGN